MQCCQPFINAKGQINVKLLKHCFNDLQDFAFFVIVQSIHLKNILQCNISI
eukprot:06911.XXX_246583_246735_1 [CDS] Oithona nana genome sequencing.